MTFLVAVTQLCGAIAVGLLPGSAEPLEVIRAAYTDQISSIDSIEATLTVMGETTSSIGVASMDGTRPIGATISWVQRGVERRAEVVSSPTAGRKFGKHSWESFDGEDSWFGQWDSSAAKRLTVRIEKGLRREAFGGTQPDDLLGRRLPQTEFSLGSLLNRSSARVVGSESVAGHDCTRVDCGVLEMPGGISHWQYTVWFDAATGMLPRRIRAERLIPAPADDATTEQWTEWTVHQFDKILDPTWGDRYFPQMAKTASRTERVNGTFIESSSTVVVTDVLVNHPVDDKSLTLDMPAGTAVTDLRDSAREKKRVVGTAAEIDDLADRMRADAEQELARLEQQSVGEPVDATPRGTSAFLWLFSASVFCLVAAGWMRWQHMRLQ